MSGRAIVILLASLWGSVFSVLAVAQYQSLHVPHGDSAMYEEHLWNILHGKGFRSQLDGGRLFLGEHFEIIHLALIPIYLAWPGLPILNVCQSFALASGAYAVFELARGARDKGWEGRDRTAVLMASAYLLYFPLQYVDLEVTWKTFRPETLGVPLLLFGLLAWERGRHGWVVVLLVLTCCCKEDYAVTTAALGVWIFMDGLVRRRPALALCGFTIASASFAFLVAVLFWIIPYFRGSAPHYSSYFSTLGSTPAEVISNIAEQPSRLWELWGTPGDWGFPLLMLGPIAFLSLASPSRLAVAIPTFAYLMASDRVELAQPWFHFHAPLVPILFWSATIGLNHVRKWISPSGLATVVLVTSFATGVWYGRGPFAWRFFDPAFGVPITQEGLFEPMGDYWRDVYLPEARSLAFPVVLEKLHREDRIASTDYIRARFTHYGAAYDYPLRPHTRIEDVDVIVLDKTEGWWGRGASNPDRELISAMNSQAPPGVRLDVRGRAFVVEHHDEYFLVVRAVR